MFRSTLVYWTVLILSTTIARCGSGTHALVLNYSSRRFVLFIFRWHDSHTDCETLTFPQLAMRVFVHGPRQSRSKGRQYKWVVSFSIYNPDIVLFIKKNIQTTCEMIFLLAQSFKVLHFHGLFSNCFAGLVSKLLKIFCRLDFKIIEDCLQTWFQNHWRLIASLVSKPLKIVCRLANKTNVLVNDCLQKCYNL